VTWKGMEAGARLHPGPGYFLLPWIHVCFTSDGAVFLDVKHDRYVGLEHPKAQILRRLLSQQPADDEMDSLGRELVASGLLTSTAQHRREPIEAPSIDAPDSLLIDSLDNDAPRPSALHVLRFLTACATVWVHLHLGSLDRALARARRRKQKLLRSARSVDMEKARQATRVFVHLRTFVYTARDHCLFDSLTLSDYLQRCGVLTSCVFGVRTLPFAAHCWVQAGKSLLTETSVEYVADFSPILVI
jgi:hypothetical protein